MDGTDYYFTSLVIASELWRGLSDVHRQNIMEALSDKPTTEILDLLLKVGAMTVDLIADEKISISKLTREPAKEEA